MIKDLLKTMLGINNDTNLKPSEKILLSSLILYHNYNMGYAYPNYEQLQITLSTNRKATVANTLKTLEEKQYITIKKARGNKNIYYINKYLFYVGENEIFNEKEKPVDSDGKKPLKNQVHIDEVLINNEVEIKDESKIIEIINYTGFNKKQSAELLAESENNTAKVINAFEYVKKQKNVEDKFKYMKWAINNESKCISVEVKNTYKEKVDSKFNNFEARGYDYDNLERALLGWDKPKDIEEYRKYN